MLVKVNRLDIRSYSLSLRTNSFYASIKLRTAVFLPVNLTQNVAQAIVIIFE